MFDILIFSCIDFLALTYMYPKIFMLNRNHLRLFMKNAFCQDQQSRNGLTIVGGDYPLLFGFVINSQ